MKRLLTVLALVVSVLSKNWVDRHFESTSDR
jgi:hypothetical protein